MRTRSRVAAGSAGVALLLIVLLWPFGARRSLKLPTGKGRAVATMGDSHGVIVASDGSLWVWGQQDLGWPALGMGTVEHQPVLKRLGKDRDWVGVAVGIRTRLGQVQGRLDGVMRSEPWPLPNVPPPRP